MFGKKDKNSMEERLRKLGAGIDKFLADAEKKYPDKFDALRAKQDAAKKRVAELGKAKDEAWDELKVGADKALDDLKDAWENAVAKFKK